MGHRLVVTADDLGLHARIDAGIIEAHRHGLVTCASLVACGGAFEHALELLEGCPTLQVAVHLTLVEERPLTDPSAVPSLVGANGRFLGSYRHFVARYLTGRVRRDDLNRELRGQVERVLASGIQPVSLNSHQHVHLLPRVWDVVSALAQEYGIPNLRLSSFQRVHDGRSLSAVPFRLGLNALAKRARAVTRGRELSIRLIPTVGLHTAGHLDERGLREILATLPEGRCELVAHPGFTSPELAAHYPWGYEWSGEVTALCAISHTELDALGVSVEGLERERAA